MAPAVLPLALAACSADQLCGAISPNHYDNCMEAQRLMRQPLHDNCPGQFPCGGRAPFLVFEPEPLPQFAPVPQQSEFRPDLEIDPPPMVPGTHGCPFVPLPGTNVCIVPMP